MNPLIHHLKITNFKSIDTLTLNDVQSFSVFAGANGCGKSNFFDALEFISVFVKVGVTNALRKYGGYKHIYSQKRRKDAIGQFDFEIDVSLSEDDKLVRFKYNLSISKLDTTPEITEKLHINGDLVMEREEGKFPKLIAYNGEEKVIEHYPNEFSALLCFPDLSLALLLRNIRLYRIDPISSKEPDSSEQDPTVLSIKGDNLASVLARLEQEGELQGIILEWMETIVPSIEKINTEQQKLDGKTAIFFKEIGTRRQFPAHMISDGTIYALCLLVAILDAPKYGLTLIEEPERGLHPKAINELVGFIREQSCFSSPLWMTTHSESVVRALQLSELWVVDKNQGKTRMKSAKKQGLRDEDFAPLGLDKAWLSNFLDGGLPW
ncbi:MAG: AAA family ATPase [Methylomarinum sp.]|nr:AAA family ATPase [Methylomarinum sp.]